MKQTKETKETKKYLKAKQHYKSLILLGFPGLTALCNWCSCVSNFSGLIVPAIVEPHNTNF